MAALLREAELRNQQSRIATLSHKRLWSTRYWSMDNRKMKFLLLEGIHSRGRVVNRGDHGADLH